jgi:beta-mannosidase
LRSAYDYTDAVAAVTGSMPGPYAEPYPLIRKMAANFGWDWGPTVVTAGIWRDIRLEAWSTARLATVQPLVTVTGPDQTEGRVEVRVTVERTDQGNQQPLTVALTIAGQTARADLAPGTTTATIVLDVGPVDLWWPHTHGPQHRYDLTVDLYHGTTLLDTWERAVGFRAIDLVTAPDQWGRSFTFTVAGQPTFIRGFNWIPNDPLVSRVTRADYRARLTDAQAAGANLIRVWGGGIYEDEAFYDVCDELGLMVWQDFLFACSAYPETPDLVAQVEAEARDNVVRLMPHPSLVIWNGNNENIWGYAEWGWPTILGDRPWGEQYYRDVLPRVVAELDPTRPYWPGSPDSDAPGLSPNDPSTGCFHSWVVWNQVDYTHYADSVPRFVSEFGWQAPATLATLRDGVGAEHLTLTDPVLLAHQKAEDGAAKLDRAVARHFRPARTLDEWLYLTQVVQARAIEFGLDHWRMHWPQCAGAIVWQLNDCWPSVSWAAVDVAGRRKPVWYAIRDAFAGRRIVLDPMNTDLGPALICLNDDPTPWAFDASVRRVDVDGTELAAWRQSAVVPPGSTSRLPLPPDLVRARTAAAELLVADVGALRRVATFVRDKEFAYVRPVADVTCERQDNDIVVRVKAQTLLRDALLQVDRLGDAAATDRGLVTLLPGEETTWRVTGWDRVPASSEVVFPLFTSVGDIEGIP